MSRKSRKRASRALIGVLGGTIVLGSVFYFRNTSRNQNALAATGGVTEPSSSSSTTGATAMPVALAKPAEPATPIVLTKGIDASASKPDAFRPAALAVASGLMPTVGVGGNAATALTVAAAITTTTTQPTTKPTGDPKAVVGQVAPAPITSTASATPAVVPTLAQAKAKVDAGQMLAARNDYNAALAAGRLSPLDARVAKAAIVDINKTIVFSPRKFTDDAWAGTYTVKPGDRMQKIANENSVTWELLCRINGMTDPKKLRAGQTLKTLKGPFHAVVSKSDFTLDLYLGAPGGPGSLFITQFAVGLGKDDSTPLGTWMVKPQSKLRNPTYYNPREDGERIVHADDPKNPLGDYWLGLMGIDGHALGKESYGIHGTIEPDSIGKMASLGCIRLLNENVAQVFDMLVETKSTVVVKE